MFESTKISDLKNAMTPILEKNSVLIAMTDSNTSILFMTRLISKIDNLLPKS